MTNVNETLLNQRENILSNRYQLLTTQDAINPFTSDAGFEIASMSYGGRRGKQADKRNTHGAHIVRLRNEAFKIGNDYVELVISNSYDGTIPFAVNLGIFRLVCSNGMVVGDSLYNARVKHIGNGFQDAVTEALNNALNHVGDLKNRVEALKGYELSDSQKLELAERVFKARLRDVKNLVGFDFTRSLRPERREDFASDAWTFINVLQEKCLRGGVHYIHDVEVKNDEGGVIDLERRKRKTQAIFQPKRTIEVNKTIFDEALNLIA